jgi:hypothetical protein
MPGDVSLIWTDPDPTFAWCEPSIAHIRWDTKPLVGRVVSWANNVNRGNEDFRKRFAEAKFIDDGTVGSVSL